MIAHGATRGRTFTAQSGWLVGSGRNEIPCAGFLSVDNDDGTLSGLSSGGWGQIYALGERQQQRSVCVWEDRRTGFEYGITGKLGEQNIQNILEIGEMYCMRMVRLDTVRCVVRFMNMGPRQARLCVCVCWLHMPQIYVLCYMVVWTTISFYLLLKWISPNILIMIRHGDTWPRWVVSGEYQMQCSFNRIWFDVDFARAVTNDQIYWVVRMRSSLLFDWETMCCSIHLSMTFAILGLEGLKFTFFCCCCCWAMCYV